MLRQWDAPGKQPTDGGLLPVKFQTQIARVTTMVDGGIRVWLDIGEQDIAAAVKLMALRGKCLSCILDKENE